jgi:hypothetical protein
MKMNKVSTMVTAAPVEGELAGYYYARAGVNP